MDIIGCDEVGTGSAVGCLCVAGVRADSDWTLSGLADSKQLSEKKRNLIRDKLLSTNQISYCIVEKSHQDIDKLGLAAALKQAYIELIGKLYSDNCQIIVDGNLKFAESNYPITSIVKADTYIPTVMAASILAKTHRDAVIKQYSNQYPMYGLDKNVGYLTAQHIQAIKKYGLSEIHRKSYNFKFMG